MTRSSICSRSWACHNQEAARQNRAQTGSPWHMSLALWYRIMPQDILQESSASILGHDTTWCSQWHGFRPAWPIFKVWAQWACNPPKIGLRSKVWDTVWERTLPAFLSWYGEEMHGWDFRSSPPPDQAKTSQLKKELWGSQKLVHYFLLRTILLYCNTCIFFSPKESTQLCKIFEAQLSCWKYVSGMVWISWFIITYL